MKIINNKIIIPKQNSPFSPELLLDIFKRRNIILDESGIRGNCSLRISESNCSINVADGNKYFIQCKRIGGCANCFWDIYHIKYKAKRENIFNLLKKGEVFYED